MNCDKTQKHKCGQSLKKLNYDKNYKFNFDKSNAQTVRKLKNLNFEKNSNSNCDKTQKLKLW